MALRSLCVHGHFYQPPREDPFSGVIPKENGASPYNNWNERIHAECYRPNAELGNFERISFNIGPTLHEWMALHDPQTCAAIMAQDQTNVRRNGVGNAMAQAYNHTILPLASRADKVTQAYWGLAEFQYRFGRNPQGMWLPETAVDLETLLVLAEMGIEFTILAPWQAEVESLDPTEPYRVALSKGRSITVFFYHRDLSTGISFNPSWTNNADHFVENEIISRFMNDKEHIGEPQLLLIASDGELYGHHQRFRDHFLTHLVNGASSSRGIDLTYPSLWLQKNPARQTISIRENTSWSCHHGVIRWMGQCDCTAGDARWKGFLRQSLNRLASELDLLYSDVAWPMGVDPWKLRNRFIYACLGLTTVDQLVNELAGHALTTDEVQRLSLLLQAQYERQRMFTSCGWYFEDFSRIEPKNNLAYAAQAVALAKRATGIDLAPQTSNDLKYVTSHHTGQRGDTVFQRYLHRAEDNPPA